MALELKKLQNGSDIRGVSLDGVPGEPITLGKEEARALTRGFILWLQDKTGKLPTEMRISVGHDSRISADALTDALIYTMMEAGIRVFDCGLASTPAMFMSTMFEGYKCDGAIMITASHLPSNRNGFKYFSKDGGLDKKDISRIIELAEAGAQLPSSLPGSVDERDLIGDYSSYLRNKIIAEVADEEDPEHPLKGLKIVVDAGNGAGGFYATRILEPLGADITGSQFLEPDGNFPNHQPNPENKAAMASISKAVIDNNADLDFKDITPKFFRDLKKFQPFGPDNSKPIFRTRNVYDYGTSKVVGRGHEHIKLELIDSKSGHPLNGIAFGQSSYVSYIKTKKSFDICYTIEENNFKQGDVLLQIESIKPNQPEQKA